MSTPSPPWAEAAYRFDLPDTTREAIAEIAAPLFRRVWRRTLDEPGFAVIRFGRPVESRELRRAMLDLAGAMPERSYPNVWGDSTSR